MFAEVFSFLLFLRLAFLPGPLRNGRAPSERYLDAVRTHISAAIARSEADRRVRTAISLGSLDIAIVAIIRG